VDEYVTEGGVTVYAFVCRPYPETQLSYPLQVYNHGGFGNVLSTGPHHGVYYGLNGTLDGTLDGGGNDGGNDLKSDELGLCLNAANNGWIGVAPSYRGEGVLVQDSAGDDIVRVESPANGHFEFCLGEATDSIALVNYFLSLGFPVYIGKGFHWVPQIVPNHVLMWGWSHGGCVTQRAVQQGAPVNAAATFSAVADDPAFYNWCVKENPGYIDAGGPQAARCSEPGWRNMHGPDAGPDLLPNAYNWRSPVWIESVDVGYGSLPFWSHVNWQGSTSPVGLKARPNVPVLMLQGGEDKWIPTDMACNLAANLGSSCGLWYYGKNPWLPGTSPGDPSYPNDTHCTNLTSWQLTGSDAGPAVVGNWNANWNLVWMDDDDHINGPLWKGILNDVQSWHNFRAFVDSLQWGVEVATPGYAPNIASVAEMCLP
jgi:hypothetical protein